MISQVYQKIVPATDESKLSALNYQDVIDPVSMTRQEETSSCSLDLMHPSVFQMGQIYLTCLFRRQQHEPLPAEQGCLWLLLPLFSSERFLFFVVLKPDRIFLLSMIGTTKAEVVFKYVVHLR